MWQTRLEVLVRLCAPDRYASACCAASAFMPGQAAASCCLPRVGFLMLARHLCLPSRQQLLPQVGRLALCRRRLLPSCIRLLVQLTGLRTGCRCRLPGCIRLGRLLPRHFQLVLPCRLRSRSLRCCRLGPYWHLDQLVLQSQGLSHVLAGRIFTLPWLLFQLAL